MLRKIEGCCGDRFTNVAKQNGILVLLHKKTPNDNNGSLKEDNPIEINLYLNKNDTVTSTKELLIRLLTHSYIEQMYEFHFRLREQTLFEDILADECLTSVVNLMVSGRKLGKANCAKALDEAIAETVFRLSQKPAREKLVDQIYSFFQEYPDRIKNQNIGIIEDRENFIAMLMKFLPKNVNID